LQQEQERLRLQQEQEHRAKEAQQARLEELYKTAVVKSKAGEWQAAQSSLEQLQQLQPGYRDSAKLQKRIEQEIAREKSERERQERDAQKARLEARYQDASQAMRGEDWPEAQRLFQELAQEAPDYRDVNKRILAITARLAGEPAAVPTRGGWLPALVTSLGWGIALALSVPLIDRYRYDNIFLIAAIPTLFIAGAFVYSLVVAGVPLSGARLAQLSLIWWIGSALAIASMVYPGYGTWSWLQ
jgi:hypothetical protein